MGLRQPAFVGFISANTISMIGDAFRVFTLMLWIYGTSNHAGIAIAGLMVAQMLPSVLGGSVAGALVDRWPRRRMLIACDVLRTVTGLGLVACVASGGHVTAVLLLVAASSTIGVASSIAGVATIPQLVADADLERANSIWTVASQISFVIGPAAGAVSFTRWGPVPALVLDAASFAVSALILMSIRLPNAPLDAEDDDEPLGRRVRAGLRYVGNDRMIRGAVIAMSLRSLCAGINNTIMIFFVAQSLRRNPADLAFLAVTNGVIQVAVGGALIALARRAGLTSNLRLGAYSLMAGGILVAIAPNLTVLIIGVVVTAVGNAPANIAHNVLEQRYVRPGLLGRVRGLQEALIPLCFLVTTSTSGALVGTVGARSLLIFSAFLLSGAAFMTETTVVRGLRHRQPASAVSGPEINAAASSPDSGR